MPAKIRLQRFGKKHGAYYHIVVADGRAPRDGKYIERIGTYNPNLNPAVIDLDTDKAMDWLAKGAQPTDTLRAILSYKGVLFKKHLAEGIKKGALTQEQADAKFALWSETKANKIDEKRKRLLNETEKEMKARLADEEAKKAVIAEKVRIKNIPPPVEEVAPVAAASEETSATESGDAPVAESGETPAAE